MAPTLTTPAMGASLWRINNKYKIPIGINSMCVAYNHLKNLGKNFTYSKVDCIDGPPVFYYME